MNLGMGCALLGEGDKAVIEPQGSGLRINNAGVHRVTGVRLENTNCIEGQEGKFWARELVISTEDAGKQYLTLYADSEEALELGDGAIEKLRAELAKGAKLIAEAGVIIDTQSGLLREVRSGFKWWTKDPNFDNLHARICDIVDDDPEADKFDLLGEGVKAMNEDKFIDTPIEELVEFACKGEPIFLSPRGVAGIIQQSGGGSWIKYHDGNGSIVDCSPTEVRDKMRAKELRP